MVQLQYPGDAVLVGYEPGNPQPTWLSIMDRPTTATSAEFELQVTDTFMVGQRSTIVRLLIRHMNSTELETFDLPVSYTVQPSDLAVTPAPTVLTFTVAVHDVVVPPQTVDVAFNGQDVMVVSVPSWAKVSALGDPAMSPASFAVAIKDTSFDPGTTLADDIVFGTARGALQRRSTVHVTCNVVESPDLALTTTPLALAFTATAGGPVPAPQMVEVAFTGASVAVVSAPSWATVTSPAMPVTSPATFAIAVNSTSFSGGTALSDDLVFRTMRGSEQKSATVHVDYHVLVRPEVQFVAPYIGIAGRPGTARIRGHGFPVSSGVTVGVGDLVIGPVVPDNDTQISVSYPALPEGRYPVALLDPVGIAPRAPELVILTPPAFAYQAIDAPAQPSRLVYDAERQAIHVLDWQNQQILHFVYGDGRWSRQPSHVIPQLIGLAMAPDGRSLIVVDEAAIREMSLTDGLFTVVERAHIPASQVGCRMFGSAAAADNGKILVLSHIHGTGLCPAYFYDMLDHSLATSDSFSSGHTASSGDGSRIFVRSTNSSSDPVKIYDSLSNTISSHFIGPWGVYAFSISGNGSRSILDDRRVYDRTLAVIGSVPYQGSSATLVSRDASRAFIYPHNTSRLRLEIYDLNGALQSDGMYPLLKTVVVPDAANGSNEYAMAMASSLDDAVVFVAGASKLLVVPVN